MNIEYGSGLLVLVGAGASHDSLLGGTDPFVEAEVPPLTKDLAQATPESIRLSQRYRECASILGELRTRLIGTPSTPAEAPSATLEDALADYAGRTDENIPRHLMAMRFYLRDLIQTASDFVISQGGEATNYTELVRRCFQWADSRDTHVCFVNFNYDTLLERACQDHFGLDLTDPSSYMSHPVASVLKPHGSTLWAWLHPRCVPVPRPQIPAIEGAFSNKRRPEVDASIIAGEPLDPIQGNVHASDEVIDRLPGNGGYQPVIPALALPMTGKSHFVWPDSQHRFFTEDIPNGSFGRVLSVGWRAAESYFRPLLTRMVHHQRGRNLSS